MTDDASGIWQPIEKIATSPLPPAPEASSADSLIATAGDPLARIDGAGGEWFPRMWDLALAATDSEEHATATVLKMVAASHGYRVNWVRQEVPDELADDGSREILSAVSAPADAPVEGLLIGRAVDEDGIINWYASPVDGVSRAVAGVPVALREPQPHPAAALVDAHGGVLAEIAAERRRQIEAEGWTPSRDDHHKRGEMAGAAACYIMSGLDIQSATLAEDVRRMVGDLWPWAASWWKPKDRRRDLIRAGALIVAEIERLDRATAKESDAREQDKLHVELGALTEDNGNG